MSRAKQIQPSNITGRRIRGLRENLGLSQEKLGVAIGIDESSARARISRYELGVHEPPLPTLKMIAKALDVPLCYLFCEDDKLAELLLIVHKFDHEQRDHRIDRLLEDLASLNRSEP